jgi:hypothetical protein
LDEAFLGEVFVKMSTGTGSFSFCLGFDSRLFDSLGKEFEFFFLVGFENLYLRHCDELDFNRFDNYQQRF